MREIVAVRRLFSPSFLGPMLIATGRPFGPINAVNGSNNASCWYSHSLHGLDNNGNHTVLYCTKQGNILLKITMKITNEQAFIISGGSRICQGEGGVDHGERDEREPKRGRGSPSGPRGTALGGGLGGEATLKLKAFCPCSYKKWPKFNDLNENLLPCLLRAATTSLISLGQWA